MAFWSPLARLAMKARSASFAACSSSAGTARPMMNVPAARMTERGGGNHETAHASP